MKIIAPFAALLLLIACVSQPGNVPIREQQSQISVRPDAVLRSHQNGLPALAAGRVERFLISSQLDATREKVKDRVIDVWLPPNYPNNGPYAVVYMWDGQMLFDANKTWNKQEWGADETSAALQDPAQPKPIRPFIVVGIANAGANRHGEYFPEDALVGYDEESTFRATYRPYANAFLSFFAQELKPAIDAKFRTLPDASNTFVIGASMGGLISWYALLQRPDLIGGAGCMSTHWPGVDPAKGNAIFNAIFGYFAKHLPLPDDATEHRKFWFDFGDKTLDAFYPPLQAKIDSKMRGAGYGAHPQLWRTRPDPGAEHNEIAWRKRLPEVLRFLLAQEK
jgi:enterochelin esterase-like enzyme